MAYLVFTNGQRSVEINEHEHTGSNKITHHSNNIVHEIMSLAP